MALAGAARVGERYPLLAVRKPVPTVAGNRRDDAEGGPSGVGVRKPVPTVAGDRRDDAEGGPSGVRSGLGQRRGCETEI